MNAFIYLNFYFFFQYDNEPRISPPEAVRKSLYPVVWGVDDLEML